GGASAVRVLVKDGVAQHGMRIEAAGGRGRRKHNGDGKEERALAMIMRRGRDGATALEIGIAMVDGTGRSWRMGIAAQELLGLTMGMGLVRAEKAVATRNNRFMLKEYDGKAVPPSVRVEDVPAPGFVRVPQR